MHVICFRHNFFCLSHFYEATVWPPHFYFEAHLKKKLVSSIHKHGGTYQTATSLEATTAQPHYAQQFSGLLRYVVHFVEFMQHWAELNTHGVGMFVGVGWTLQNVLCIGPFLKLKSAASTNFENIKSVCYMGLFYVGWTCTIFQV